MIKKAIVLISILLLLGGMVRAAETPTQADVLSNGFLAAYVPTTEQVFKAISEFEDAKQRSMKSDDLKADPKFSAIKNRLTEVSALYNVRTNAHGKLEVALANKTTDALLGLTEACDEFVAAYDVNRDMGSLLKTAESTLSDAAGIETESLQAALKGSFEDASSRQALQDITQKYQAVESKNKSIVIAIRKFEDTTDSGDRKATKQVLNVFTNLLASELSRLDRVKVIYASESDPNTVPDFTVTGKVIELESDNIRDYWTGKSEGHHLKARAEVTLLNKSGNVVKSYRSGEEEARSTSTDIENFRSPIEKTIVNAVKNIAGEIK